jgi:hypothetical protein
MDDINALTYYYGDGYLFEYLNSFLVNPLNSVTINHVTGFASPSAGQSGLIEGGNTTYTTSPMYAFVFTNNIVDVANHYALYSTGGGSANCAYPSGSDPLTILNACFTTYTFNYNAIVNPRSTEVPAHWPSGNFFAASDAAVDFVNYNGGNGGNYTLQSTSPYYQKGTDGKDLGADIVGLNAALANVK